MLCTAAALVSVVVRYRRSRGEERAQLKWFTYAIVLLIGEFFLSQVLQPLLGRPLFLDLIFIASLSLIPVSIGVSILRYRLYDIDRIISRTLVYGALTPSSVSSTLPARSRFSGC